MALLSTTDPTGQYSLSFILNSAETYADNHFEGWLSYDLELAIDDKIITKCSGTITDGDVCGLIACLKIGQHSKEELLPLEPDFSLSTERHDDDGISVSCFIDDGNRITKIYSDCGIALHFVTNVSAAHKFANEIEAELNRLTDGLIRVA